MRTLFIIYLISINLATFIIRGRDKRKATTKKRRVSEKQLLWLVVLGGGAGALLGQHSFRHKTIKGRFVWKLYGALLIRLLILTVYIVS